ncbi:polysaccharide biosynthesis protein [Limnohabitans sp. MMS-10A-160]|nr:MULTISPECIES: nucleoside-diphosphate sugar epimerase/dehydratase [unclassified Limnohabitans]PUE19626.1 polysaccharide biosynthesis protein [Limnohabitans sp. MMS-10A-192]PUE26987.1 polysaccharide biosynthesis protein [Limnohabitans sp. MMS-10A-160]
MLSRKVANFLVSLPRPIKRIVAVAVDGALCVLTVWAAFDLRFDALTPWSSAHAIASVLSFALGVTVFTGFGLYRAIFRYAGLPALITVLKAIAAYSVLYGLVMTVISVPGIPRTVGVLQPLLLLIAITLSRVTVRVWLGGIYRGILTRQNLPKVLIYGAGSAGRQLAAALKTSPELVVVGLLDDDDRLHGQVLNGLKIYNPQDLLSLVGKLRVNQVFLAIPSVSRARRNEILDVVRAAHVQVRTLPGVMDLAQGRVHVSDLRELEVEDLLGRDPVPPNPLMMGKNITSKVVMVTGAGGSIGSELCRQIVTANPSTLLLVELTEFALYDIHYELEQTLAETGNESITLVPLLANVRDADRMAEILRTWRPSTVYHAAAYKHVPLVEHNPAEGIKNNVHGTLVTAQQAALHGVSDFVLVSTDKAVRPTNVMGASKRLAEMVLQAQAEAMKAQGGQTRFSMVRFGNVLGSSGSVVPLFRRQIKDGGPITLTDERITRYFMTIPEAAQLVIQAGAMASGGDVFVLDMGEPVKIMDLAKRMVELSGLSVRGEANPEGDIEIAVTGLRPGEKLYEELLIGDNPLPTSHKRIMKAHEEFLSWSILQGQLAELNKVLNANDVPVIRSLLKGLVPGYQPDGDVVDWVWMENEKSA